MTQWISTIIFSLLCSPSLLYSAEIEAPNAEQQDDTFANNLSQEELDQIKREADRQSRQSTSQEAPQNDSDSDLVNPYASLLKKHSVEPQNDKKTDAPSPKITHHKKHSSTTRTYDRYKTGNRRPGDALKSTPAQRAFGK